MKKGLFITFEGGEGAGKTTLIQELKKTLSSSYKVVVTREPGGSALGEKIREILLHAKDLAISPYAELALFLASRAQHVKELILPEIEKGSVVLCDRFNDSSIAYQGAARHLGIDEVTHVSSFFTENLTPDLTFYLDLDPRVGLKRNTEGFDRIEAEEISFHEKLRSAYLKLAKKEPNRVHKIDATLSPQEVYRSAWQVLEKFMSSCK